MAKKSYNEIPNLDEDWGLDPRNGLKYSGASVQKFIKKQLSQIDQKVGHMTYETGKIQIYDSPGGTLLGSIAITGTSYAVKVETNLPSNNITVLEADTTYPIVLTPTTKSMEFGSSVEEDYFEDYTFSVEVDNGDGYVDKTPEKNTIKEGDSESVDIRGFLKMGLNKVRINVKGLRSEQTKSTVIFATMTSLNLTCNHPWQKVWYENEDFYLQNIYIAGNVEKTLRIKVGDTMIEKVYSATTQYVTVPTSVELTEKPAESGIIPVEMWLESAGASTKTIRFNLMYVTNSDRGNISLICTNKVKEEVYNFREEVLMEYAVYGFDTLRTTITATYEGREARIVNTTQAVETDKAYPLQLNLNIDTATTEGIVMEVNLEEEGGTASVTKIIGVNNAYAYIPAEGYKFYLNPSLASNEDATRELLINSAPKPENAGDDWVESYQAQWTNFTFETDAWTTDPEGNKALMVGPFCQLRVPEFKPFKGHGLHSSTFEIMFRVPISVPSASIGADTPVIAIGSITEEAEGDMFAEGFTGLLVTTDKIILHGQNLKRTIYQSIPYPENSIIHLTVVLQREYAGTGRGLARIFINGCENVTFTYSGADNFYIEEGNVGVMVGSGIPIAQYVYMMRSYDKALESSQVFANYLNAVIETAGTSRSELSAKNRIIDGNTVSYDMCKAAGLNCFIVETPNNGALPNFDQQSDGYESGVNVHLEYAETPEWNVSIYNVPMDRQGTTSKLYYRANLRSKVGKDAKWVYPNLAGGAKEETGKEGYIAGYGLTPPVSKITWKKNVASQPQGHKMGATSFYNDLYKEVFGASSLVAEGILPREDARVAVYQHPFMGFHKKGDVYEFIGLYTGGPDKTDKKTFGYNETERYPSLMMIEGPNHAPRLTRFLVPWVDVFYDAKNETLSTGDPYATGKGKEEGWDGDIVADYSTDDTKDAAAILALYESEFKPAYEAVYYNSPYIASLAATGYSSVDAINSDLTTFLSLTTEGYKNDLLTFYNSNYELVYYRTKTGKFEVLPKSEHDMLAHLKLGGSPDTEAIRKARAENWVVEVGKYVNLSEAYYRQVFAELIAASDNDAKNSYWRKFKKLKGEGGKWGFNEDDLDTIFLTDNNGQDTKNSYIEPDDLNAEGNEIFQGSDSAFWKALRMHSEPQLRDMMKRLVEACMSIAGKKGIYADTVHETVKKVIGHYFWEKSSKYFPATAYNADTVWTYLDVWQKNPGKTYNGVPPLTQIHGDHYEAEKEWVDKRLVYVFSKYQVGAFEAEHDDGFNALSFTALGGGELALLPMIPLYPCISRGGSSTISGGRTYPMSAAVFPLSGSSDTILYVKGMDWMYTVQGLHALTLTSRGGSDQIPLDIRSRRMFELELGHERPEEVRLNITSLSLQCDFLQSLVASHIKTLTGSLDLSKCPCLMSAVFLGTNLSAIYPGVGSIMSNIHYPASLSVLFLHSLRNLAEGGLEFEGKRNISTLYINNCPNISPFKHLLDQNFEGSKLRQINLSWEGMYTLQENEGAALEFLARIAEGRGVKYFGCEWIVGSGGDGSLQETAYPIIKGKIDATNVYVYEEDIQALMDAFDGLEIVYNPKKTYVKFEDPEVQRIMTQKYGDGRGVTKERAATITEIGGFKGSGVKTFNDTWKLPNLRILKGNAFYECLSLTEIDVSNIEEMDDDVFNRCPITTINAPKLKEMGSSTFWNCDKLVSVVAPNLTYIGRNAFSGCSSLAAVDMPNVTGAGDYAFSGCSSLAAVNMPNVTELGKYAFRGCSSLAAANLGAISKLESGTFQDCKALLTYDFSGVESIEHRAFQGAGLSGIIELPNVKSLGAYAFYETDITAIITRELQECNENLEAGPKVELLDLSFTQTFFEKDVYGTEPNLVYHRIGEGKGVTFVIRTSSPPPIKWSGIFISCPSEGSYNPEVEEHSPKAIYVPDDAVEAYKTAENWSAWASIIHPLSEYVGPTE